MAFHFLALSCPLMTASSNESNPDTWSTAWTFQGIFNIAAMVLCCIAGGHAFLAGDRTFASPFGFAFATFFAADALLAFRKASDKLQPSFMSHYPYTSNYLGTAQGRFAGVWDDGDASTYLVAALFVIGGCVAMGLGLLFHFLSCGRIDGAIVRRESNFETVRAKILATLALACYFIGYGSVYFLFSKASNSLARTQTEQSAWGSAGGFLFLGLIFCAASALTHRTAYPGGVHWVFLVSCCAYIASLMCVCFGIADWWRKGSDTTADSGLEVANGFAGMGCSVAAIMAAVGTLMGFCRAGKPNLKAIFILGGFCCFYLMQAALFWSVNTILRDPSSFTTASAHDSSSFQAALLFIGAVLMALASICGDRHKNSALVKQPATTAVQTKGSVKEPAKGASADVV